jgi:predicted Zn finger-like uncharacterized protein
MPISVSCGECGTSYTVKDEAAGRKFKCRECSAVIEVPAGLGVAPQPAADRAPVVPVPPRDEAAPRELSSTAPPRRRRTPDAPSSGSSALGKASLIIGVSAWALTVLAFAGIMIAAALVGEGGRRPEPHELATVGFAGIAGCGTGCFSFVGAIVGVILGIIAVSQPSDSKTPAVVGLILNGLFVALAAGFVVVSMVVGANN